MIDIGTPYSVHVISNRVRLKTGVPTIPQYIREEVHSAVADNDSYSYIHDIHNKDHYFHHPLLVLLFVHATSPFVNPEYPITNKSFKNTSLVDGKAMHTTI